MTSTVMGLQNMARYKDMGTNLQMPAIYSTVFCVRHKGFPSNKFIFFLTGHVAILIFIYLFIYLFIFQYFNFLNSVTIVCIFSLSLHPTPAKPTSLPHLYPPPRFCPCVLHSSSCRPLSTLYHAHSPLAIVTFS